MKPKRRNLVGKPPRVNHPRKKAGWSLRGQKNWIAMKRSSLNQEPVAEKVTDLSKPPPEFPDHDLDNASLENVSEIDFEIMDKQLHGKDSTSKWEKSDSPPEEEYPNPRKGPHPEIALLNSLLKPLDESPISTNQGNSSLIPHKKDGNSEAPTLNKSSSKTPTPESDSGTPTDHFQPQQVRFQNPHKPHLTESEMKFLGQKYDRVNSHINTSIQEKTTDDGDVPCTDKLSQFAYYTRRALEAVLDEYNDLAEGIKAHLFQVQEHSTREAEANRQLTELYYALETVEKNPESYLTEISNVL